VLSSGIFFRIRSTKRNADNATGYGYDREPCGDGGPDAGGRHSDGRDGSDEIYPGMQSK
jgi:hypothetical protein